MHRYWIYAHLGQIYLRGLKTSSETYLKKKSLPFRAEDAPSQEVVCVAVGNVRVGSD